VWRLVEVTQTTNTKGTYSNPPHKPIVYSLFPGNVKGFSQQPYC
jgi:hypothetical protein